MSIKYIEVVNKSNRNCKKINNYEVKNPQKTKIGKYAILKTTKNEVSGQAHKFCYKLN